MKKITESQLKDKVNSLREYLKVYENQQVDEWSIFNPSTWGNGQGYEGLTGGNSRDEQRTQDAAKNSTAGANMALVQHREQLAPGSVASETGSDGVTYAVDAKGMRTFKIENGKWVAMTPATPTENPELQAAPGPGPQAVKIARFKELLAKAALTPQNDPAMKDFMGEGSTYFLNKLRLIESRQLNEATLSPEEQKEMDDLYAELGNTESPEPEVAELINQYNALKKTDQAPAPAPVAVTGPINWKQIYELNKDIIGNNPNLIKPGQQLKMPDGSTYTVKPGDNLTKIAKNASGGQGASVTPTAPAAPKAPTAPAAPKAPTAPKLPANYEKVADPDAEARKNAGRPGYDEAGRPITGQIMGASTDPAVQQAVKDASGGQFVAKTAPSSTQIPAPNAPGQNARDDLLARQGKVAESVGYNELERIVSLVNHR